MNTEHDDTTGPDDTGRSWNSRPPAGDELNRMLVTMKQDVLTRAAAEPRAAVTAKRRRRLFGITFGVVALVAVGGASGAIALGMIPSPFEGLQHAAPTAAPTASTTPTPKPTVTAPPVAEPDYGPPATALPMDCATVGSSIGVTSLLRAPELYAYPVDSVYAAAASQAGDLLCNWRSVNATTGATAGLQVRVDTDVDGARAAIKASLTEANTTYTTSDIGDAGSQNCIENLSCVITTVVGPYAAVVTYDSATPIGADAQARLVSGWRSFIDQAAGLTPAPRWQMPPNGWSDRQCATLPSGATMSAASGTTVGDPETPMEGYYAPTTPRPVEPVSCIWSSGTSAAPGSLGDIVLNVAPGGRWAFDAQPKRVLPGEDGGGGVTYDEVSLTGADAAAIRCHADGGYCDMNVLTDDSWLQISFGAPGQGPGDPRMIAVAEAILAGR